MDTTQTPTTALGLREFLARRIAREDGHAIIGPSDDWTFFMLDDDLTTDKGILRTCYAWGGHRWEGFVSFVG